MVENYSSKAVKAAMNASSNLCTCAHQISRVMPWANMSPNAFE
jgi:hypothetical protein